MKTISEIIKRFEASRTALKKRTSSPLIKRLIDESADEEIRSLKQLILSKKENEN